MNVWRIRFLKFLVVFVMAWIIANLFWVQVIEHKKWVAKAERQQIMQKIVPAKRGEIYFLDDKTPTLAVANRTVWSVAIDPFEAVKDKKRIKEVLEREIKDKILVSSLDLAFNDQMRRYFLLAKGVDIKRAEKIKKEGLRGLWLIKDVERVYPEGELASSVLGFVNSEGKGQYGVEGALDEDLKGVPGKLKTVKDVNNIPLTIGADNIRVAPKDGKNIVLTIDRNIQYGVEKIIASTGKEKQADYVNAVVLNAKNGKVMAMANWPSYDLTKFGLVKDAKVFNNQIADEPYEAASVCKTFVFAAAIDQGVMNAKTTYENTDKVVLDGLTIKNAHLGILGAVDMQKAFVYSLNTGSVEALAKLGGGTVNEKGREILYEYYYDRFGLGRKTGFELYEAVGMIPKPNEGRAMNHRYGTMTFGQSMNVTMLQAVAGFASVVNGGLYYRPTVLAGEIVNGVFVSNKDNETKRRTVSTSTSEQMREILQGTRNYERLVGIDKKGYITGGKTGTAEVFRDGSYAKKEFIVSYIGFSGAKMPEFVIMVRIGGEGKAFDSWKDARPLFNEINSFVLDYLKIKPKV